MTDPSIPAHLPFEGRLAPFDGATAWLNSPVLTTEALRGKVVLVDFWTFTCINWLRTRGYVRAWADKYREQGLVVIGVHTPEFPFEGELDNVRWAVKEMRIDFPVAVDTEYGVWNAFANHYWPAIYLADAQGRIRYHHFGEGEYEEGERVIQQLLREAGAEGIGDDLVSVPDEGVEAQADWAHLESPETYLGYEQGRNFVSEGEAAFGRPHRYASPGPLELNQWSLSGDWTIESGAGLVNRAGGSIVFRFHARDANLVLAPPPGEHARFRVTVDGRDPGTGHGLDIDEHGEGTIVEPRMYQLLRLAGPAVDRTFEITFLDPGARAYVFTFG
ncbi:redoxin domain-containing protein [Diaminobutyricibacter sp. McL0608]|uniref:redoxin domain-containing protein n=1 Tax=Leifsonia sp. McL0608 TaxID=3143537 RepID=UPI0031F2F124